MPQFLSLAEWSVPVTDAAPAGANLEYDQRFQDLERAAAGTREQQYGDTVIDAKPPDWTEMRSLLSELCTQTRDLRIGVLAVETATHFDGFAGLADALTMLRNWVCEHWADVHPTLDAEDGNDPFVRINALARLCEEHRLPKQILALPLAVAPPHLRVCLADVESIRGNHSGLPAAPSRLSGAEIEATFLAASLADLRATFDACQRSFQALHSIVSFLEQTTGSRVWDADRLRQRLRQCAEVLKTHLQERLSAADSAVEQVSAIQIGLDSADNASDWSLHSMDLPSGGVTGFRITSREQAGQVIEQVIEFFEHNEPSSPVPLLLRRAKRLINQRFVEILRDVAPDGLSQVHSLSGITDSP